MYRVVIEFFALTDGQNLMCDMKDFVVSLISGISDNVRKVRK